MTPGLPLPPLSHSPATPAVPAVGYPTICQTDRPDTFLASRCVNPAPHPGECCKRPRPAHHQGPDSERAGPPDGGAPGKSGSPVDRVEYPAGSFAPADTGVTGDGEMAGDDRERRKSGHGERGEDGVGEQGHGEGDCPEDGVAALKRRRFGRPAPSRVNAALWCTPGGCRRPDREARCCRPWESRLTSRHGRCDPFRGKM